MFCAVHSQRRSKICILLESTDQSMMSSYQRNINVSEASSADTLIKQLLHALEPWIQFLVAYLNQRNRCFVALLESDNPYVPCHRFYKIQSISQHSCLQLLNVLWAAIQFLTCSVVWQQKTDSKKRHTTHRFRKMLCGEIR